MGHLGIAEENGLVMTFKSDVNTRRIGKKYAVIWDPFLEEFAVIKRRTGYSWDAGEWKSVDYFASFSDAEKLYKSMENPKLIKRGSKGRRRRKKATNPAVRSLIKKRKR